MNTGEKCACCGKPAIRKLTQFPWWWYCQGCYQTIAYINEHWEEWQRDDRRPNQN